MGTSVSGNVLGCTKAHDQRHYAGGVGEEMSVFKRKILRFHGWDNSSN